MYCSNCGSEIKEGQKFCKKCGAPVGGNNETAGMNLHEDVSGNKPTSRENNRMTIMIAAAFVIVAVVIIIVVVSHGGHSEGEQIAEEKALQDDTELDSVQIPETETEFSLEDRVSILDVTMQEFTYVGAREGTTGLVATGTIQNDNDVPCTVMVNFEYEGTNYNNSGDAQTSIDYTSHAFDVPADSSYSMFDIVSVDLNNLYDEYDYNHVSYTGNLTTSVSAYESEVNLLPVDRISDLSFSINAEQSNQIDCTITLPNTTDFGWSSCSVTGVVLINGEYDGYNFSASAESVNPGEDATLIGDTVINTDAKQVIDQITFVPTDVIYIVDTGY